MAKLPDRWAEYQSMGRRVPGTRFIAFKVPLKGNCEFTTRDVVDYCPNLGLVIDLTNTCKYYSPQDFLDQNVEYVKIKLAGRVKPTERNAQSFFDAVDDFLERNRRNDKLIGVHCTHGLNRTGYMVCRYMIQVLGVPPDQAIVDFDSARGHNQERAVYLDNLRQAPWLDTRDRFRWKKPNNGPESPLSPLFRTLHRPLVPSRISSPMLPKTPAHEKHHSSYDRDWRKSTSKDEARSFIFTPPTDVNRFGTRGLPSDRKSFDSRDAKDGRIFVQSDKPEGRKFGRNYKPDDKIRSLRDTPNNRTFGPSDSFDGSKLAAGTSNNITANKTVLYSYEDSPDIKFPESDKEGNYLDKKRKINFQELLNKEKIDWNSGSYNGPGTYGDKHSKEQDQNYGKLNDFAPDNFALVNRSSPQVLYNQQVAPQYDTFFYQRGYGRIGPHRLRNVHGSRFPNVLGEPKTYEGRRKYIPQRRNEHEPCTVEPYVGTSAKTPVLASVRGPSRHPWSPGVRDNVFSPNTPKRQYNRFKPY